MIRPRVRRLVYVNCVPPITSCASKPTGEELQLPPPLTDFQVSVGSGTKPTISWCGVGGSSAAAQKKGGHLPVLVTLALILGRWIP